MEKILTAGSSCVMVLSLITDGDGEVGLGMELALDAAPTLNVSTLRVLAGDTLLQGLQGTGVGQPREQQTNRREERKQNKLRKID